MVGRIPAASVMVNRGAGDYTIHDDAGSALI